MQTDYFISIIITLLFVAGFSYFIIKKFIEETKKKEEEIKHKMYELAILKEISDRTGYSLNMRKIVDIITGSLDQFIEYGTASYMIIEPDKILFKTELKKPVSKEFVSDVKKRMLDSLSALFGKDLSQDNIEEVVTGVIASKESKDPVKSFFNIPLVIGGNVVGVLTVAHTKSGLYKENEMTLLYKIVGQASRAVSSLEEVIKTEQGKLGAMVESLDDGVVMTDTDYRIIAANPAIKRIVGLENKKEVTIFDFIDKLSGKFDIYGKLEESIKMSSEFAVDGVIIDGKVFQIFASPVKGTVGAEKEKIFGGVVVFHDVTKIKEAEKMRKEFTSMIVHELRSPLDGIKKMGELMRSDKTIRKDEKAYNEYLKMMYKSSSDMLELVNDLLDVSKIESGKFDVNKKPSNIKKIINERIKFFKTSAKDAKIKLEFLSGKNIPEEVLVDPIRISQVLNNLISNAVKFTRAGGIIIIQAFIHKNGKEIEKEVGEAGIRWFVKDNNGILKNYPDAIFIAVTDTGEGIREDNIGKLFNKFTQFEAAARSEKRGTGLGLVIAKGIVEAHGGKIGVFSQEGVGSTFYFTINLR
jgi:PAS domain S-box-containing protein